MKKKFILITYGCPKNEVDSDIIASRLINSSSFAATTSLDDADFVIFNTCSFLQESIKENIKGIREICDLKKKFKFKVAVTGCLVDRFKEEVQNLEPRVDFWIPGNYQPILGEIILNNFREKIEFSEQGYIYKTRPGASNFTNRNYAYLKISEGCNRPCSFCVIPKIRGKFRSRKIEDIIIEAEELISQGFKEIILVAQDLSNYGSDLYPRVNLCTLLQKLNDLRGEFWIRCLYLYPIGVTDALLDSIVNLDKVVKYLDIPFQHSSERVLKLMKRPIGRFSPRSLVEKIRSISSSLSIRTTFIVGHPGETESDFKDLIDFISWAQLDNVGVFCYSDEPESESFRLQEKIRKNTAKARRAELMRIQQRISATKLAKLVGTKLQVLTEKNGKSARAYFQAPEIDGMCVPKNGHLRPDSFIEVYVRESGPYDLVVEPITNLKLCEGLQI